MKLPIYNFRRADERVIEAIYESLPTIDCKGLCHESCGPIAATRLENERIRRRTGDALACAMSGRCSKLDDANRCTAYSSRPIICRVFGVADDMRCPHGCQPSRFMSKKEASDLIMQSHLVGGGTVMSPAELPAEIVEKYGDNPEAMAIAEELNQARFDETMSRSLKEFLK